MPRFFFFLFFLNFLKGFGELDENKFSSTGSSLYEWRAAECNKYRNRFSVLSDKNEVQSRAFDWLLSLTLRNRKEKKIKKKEKGGLLNSSFVWLARQSLNLLPRHPESIRVRRCLWKWIAKRIKKNKRDKTRKSAVGERGALSMGRQCLPSLVSSPLNLFFFSSFFLSSLCFYIQAIVGRLVIDTKQHSCYKQHSRFPVSFFFRSGNKSNGQRECLYVWELRVWSPGDLLCWPRGGNRVVFT